MTGNQHHVVPNPNGGWDVRRDGSQRSSGHFGSKKEAVDRGRTISRNQHTELVIHGSDGRIDSRDSHGRDPRSRRG